jgi:hypothetical protein
MGKSDGAAALAELARSIISYSGGPWSPTALHGPALSASTPPAGPCTLRGSTSEPVQDQIERRAYELWQRAGFPEGRDKEFENQARQELRKEEKSEPSQLPR